MTLEKSIEQPNIVCTRIIYHRSRLLSTYHAVLQALRFPDDEEMKDHIREQLWDWSPQAVRSEAEKHAHRGRSDWNDNLVFRESLLHVLTLKISQHRELLVLLEDTGDRELRRIGTVRS